MTSAHATSRMLWVITLTVGGLLSAVNLIFGDLNQDEGWYLYAARLMSEGWWPYRDFAFTQGPMLPLIYGLMYPVVDALGVGGGRLLTMLVGFAAALFASALAWRLGGRSAGLLTLALLLLNVYHSYFTTVVKTYALCGLFITAGFYALGRKTGSQSPAWLLLAGFSFAAAAGTRLSAGVLLPVVGLWLLFARKYWGAMGWFWFGIGGGAGLTLILAPFYLMAPEGFTFGLIQYHTLREGGGGLAHLAFKGGFISRMVQAYFVAAVLVAAMVAAKVWRPFKGTDTGYHDTAAFNLIRLMWAGALAMTLVHLTAPFPYDDYQVPVFPLVAVALGVSWAYALRAWSGMGYRWRAGEEPADPPVMRWFLWVVVLAGVAASFSSPLNQEWMIAGRDRIWWNIKKQPALLQLRDVARALRAEAEDGLLLTQDTYLAVEAGLMVPPGWEMGPFSYYPDMPTGQARALHLVNKEIMLNDLATYPSRMAAFSGYGLSIASPEVQPLGPAHEQELLDVLLRRYEPVSEVPRFGQAATTLKTYRLKPGP